MNDRLKGAVKLIAVLFIAVLVFFVIFINVTINKHKPVFVSTETESREWTLTPGYESEMIQSNFWAYANAAYVLVGSAPDYQFYKIASNVPRNNYDVDNFFVDDGGSFMYYHDENANKISRVAVDVSSYQADVDWEAVKAAGVDMAIIRAGYRGYGTGKIVTDDMFVNHIEAALEAGLDVGVYFFTQALNYNEGVEEANYTLNLIRDYNITGPVIIDTEEMNAEGVRTEDLDIDARTDSIVGFCETVKAAGYEPMVYSNRNWFVQQLDMSRVGNYKLWLAHYSNQPNFPYLYTAWQYTSEGRVAGNNIDLDMNVWIE